jgi:hypothetical protein
MLEITNRPSQLWPTMTLSVDVQNSKEFNRSLAQIILDNERKIREMLKTRPPERLAEEQATNLGFNFLRWDYPEVREFRQIVLSSVREYFALIGDPDDPGLQISGIGCWANVMRFGEGIAIHHHDPAFVSGHYQVRSGGYEDGSVEPGNGDGGHTVYFRPGFMDRCHGIEAAVTATNVWDKDWRISIPSEEGRLFFFPSYIRHEVRPYLGPTERISIGFDVFVKKQRSLINFRGKRWFIPE